MIQFKETSEDLKVHQKNNHILKTGRESTGSDLTQIIVQENKQTKTKRGVFQKTQPCPRGMNPLEDKVSLCSKGKRFRQ